MQDVSEEIQDLINPQQSYDEAYELQALALLAVRQEILQESRSLAAPVQDFGAFKKANDEL